MVRKLLHGSFEAACNTLDDDVFRQIVETVGVAINKDLNLGEGGEVLDAKSEAPFRHSILCTRSSSLRCSTFGIDPASNSREVPQQKISRLKYFKLLNPVTKILPSVPKKVLSSRKSKEGIAPRIATSSDLILNI